MSGVEEIIKDLRLKTEEKDGIFYYLTDLTDFQKQEIEFHNKIHQDEIEIHQLNTIRNKYYHDYFKKFLYQLPKESIILEIGSGSGYDLRSLVNKGYQLIVSDISEQSVKSIKKDFGDKALYLVADGGNLPLPDYSVAATFMVAAWHHFENQQKALTEIIRVTKRGGLIILAMEPSRFMMWVIGLFKGFKNLRIHPGQSAADETHKGFTKKDLEIAVRESQIANQETRAANSDVRTAMCEQRTAIYKRVWLLLGFLHYKLEAIYRIFKLKKRIKVPRFIEWVLLIIDEIVLRIPIVNQLNWHWIVIINNRNSHIANRDS